MPSDVAAWPVAFAKGQCYSSDALLRALCGCQSNKGTVYLGLGYLLAHSPHKHVMTLESYAAMLNY